MFIAMNRFQVIPGEEDAFERLWLSRDTQLGDVPGFIEFHLLRGDSHEDHTLFSSHTVWQSRADSRNGPVRRPFGPRIVMRGATNPFISGILASKASPSYKR